MTEREKKGAVVQVFSATQKRNENDGGQRGIKQDGEGTQREACAFCYVNNKSEALSASAPSTE